MFGAIAGGIASALAGGAMSKLFGGGQKAASGGSQGDVLATDNNTVGMGDAGIEAAIQGSTEGVYCSRCVYNGKHQSFQATAGFRDYAPNAYSSSNGWSVFYQRSEERRVGKECRYRMWPAY